MIARAVLDEAGSAVAHRLQVARASQQAESGAPGPRLFSVELITTEKRLGLTVPALSVFSAAAAAMSLVIMLDEASTDDFLNGTARVVSVTEH